MEENAHNDPDPDATLMERAAEIASRERQACAVHCPDATLCELVARLAVRVARAENTGLDWEEEAR